ncbi:MAG TPA: trimethylamine methyltransferase family protein [Steroidobacteraceae bacterium]|nr:trimethylamine methyltransferase family protein [Steroidobacteraceae bacterium]
MRHESASQRKRRAHAAINRPADPGVHFGPTAPYEPLTHQAATRLIEAAFTLLEQTGVAFDTDTEAPELFAAAGCKVAADGVVKLDRTTVERALASVARQARLWDRGGERYLELDNRHTWFMPGMTCIKVFDLDSGELRASTGADLAMITRVADALPNIDGVCVACKDVEHSDIHGEIAEFAIMARNTTKPLEYLCEHAESFGVAIEMASAIRGSREALAEKPYFLQIITPLPLNYAKTHIDQVIMAARAGVPVSVGTLPIGGASSPITAAGCISQSLATDFAGMTLGQLARQGSFVIGSSDVCFMEPATGGIGNFVQTSLSDMVMCQVRRELGIPSFTGIGGQCAARSFNQDAVWELSSNLMQAFYSRPATCDYLGSIDEGMTYSLQALLFCNDVAGLLRSLWQGVTVDDVSLALSEAQTVGPRGNYLALDHTASHCREQLWQTRYFGPHLPTRMSSLPDRDLAARIDVDLRQIIDTHTVPELPAAVIAEIDAIRARFAASLAAGLPPNAAVGRPPRAAASLPAS